MQRATRRQLLGIAGLGALALSASVLFSPATIVEGLGSLTAAPLQLALVLAAVYLVRPFLLWPGTAVALALGYLYGPIVAFPIALAGVGLSALPPYAIARYASSESGVLAAVASTGQDLVGVVGEMRSVLVARLWPLPGDAVSYAAGLSEVSVGAFVAGTVAGEVPWMAVSVLAGDSMRTLALSQFSLGPATIVAIAGLGLLVLSGPLYSRFGAGPNPD
jgi:uncharacterized membrane protein YdjX (TVP38/TMEM64 family)